MNEQMAMRAAKLNEGSIASGARVFDEEFGLCTMTNDRPIYNGHGVAWTSAPYCRVLFETGQDLERANRILGRILDYQYLDAGMDDYGNFLALAEWDRVKDNNGITFTVFNIGDILIEHADKLTPENTRRMMEQMEIAAVGLLHRTCIWFYTNIFVMGIAGKFMLAKALDRPDLARLAVTEWNRWLERTSVENISEFNSDSYTYVQFAALLTIEKYSPDPRVAREAKKAADFMITAYAANFHMESRALTGTMSRAYRGSLINSCGNERVFVYYVFGIPEMSADELSEVGYDAVHLTRNDYTPPQQAVDLMNKSYPFELTERNASFWGKDYAPGVLLRKNYQTADFSFSTYNGVWAHYGHELSFLISIAAAPERGFVFMEKKPQYAFIDMYLTQEENWAVGGMYHHVPDIGFLKLWWKELPIKSEKCINYGLVENENVLVDGKAWDGVDIELTLPADIAVKRSGVMMGAKVFPPPSDINLHEVKVRLERIDGDALLSFTFLNERDESTVLGLPPAVVGLAFGVEAGEDLRAFSDKLSKLEIQQSVSGDVWKLSARPGSREIVSETPLTPEKRENIRLDHTIPITEPLLECPGLRIMPGKGAFAE